MTWLIDTHNNEEVLKDILGQNRFKLSDTEAFGERGIRNKEINGKYSHYISFTRVENAKEGYSQLGCNVRLEFNGDLLNRNYRGKSIDYYGKRDMSSKERYSDIMKNHPKIQNEDRLFSNEEYIEDVKRFITGIDVYYTPNDIDYIMDVIMPLNGSEKIHFYENENDFKIRDNRFFTANTPEEFEENALYAHEYEPLSKIRKLTPIN